MFNNAIEYSLLHPKLPSVLLSVERKELNDKNSLSHLNLVGFHGVLVGGRCFSLAMAKLGTVSQNGETKASAMR